MLQTLVETQTASDGHQHDPFSALPLLTRNCLALANIHSIDDLASLTAKDILSQPNFRRQEMMELRQFLAGRGRTFTNE